MAKEFNEARRFPQIAAGKRPAQRRRGPKKERACETDAHRLAQREKQIMYGEATPGYTHLMKALELYPELFKGCIPVKPPVMQKCSKRCWDGQIRRWRRALHMYDFVDFEEGEQGSKFIREALIEQNKNPLFSKAPLKALPEGADVASTGAPEGPHAADVPRVRYSLDDLMALSESSLVAAFVPLPEALQWLDKRVDLEDDVEDEDSDAGAPRAAPGPPPPPPAGTPDTVGPVRLFAEPLTPSASSECGMTPEKLWGTPSPVEGSPYREEGALALQPPTCGHQLVQVPVQLVPLFQVYSPLVCKPQQLLLRV
eukprot:CAMPEP_0174300734 /NCGR_PEP_ID=MMETSP0809-20121228/58634_1 /TAXON_ID=73025 ORGANISM="Eutreptiella gymnastica-like, Strain CCMP1594" /NCGR_SAMPLE_ID=MMETSP0809 /ASSEMBLY_ACC=CAM_ASM_000658 /LENGTH=311 /DNA_ID=CAMNT_0015406363 /DNA_START=27 /DNA_END=962 /DNA_ORIENTATION=-